MVAVLLLALVGSSGDSASAWQADWSCLLAGSDRLEWIDSELAHRHYSIDLACRLGLERAELVNLMVKPAIHRDSTETVSLRSARMSLRWPGTPWIGAAAHYSDHHPFSMGLYRPLVPLSAFDIDSLQGVSLSAGGLLGFKGRYSLLRDGASDTLVDAHVQAPWLGFGTFGWERFEDRTAGPGEHRIDIVRGWADLRYLRPHLIYMRQEGPGPRWAIRGEIRGLEVLRTRSVSIEAIPGICLTGDSLDFASPELGAASNRFDLRVNAGSVASYLSGWALASQDLDEESPDSLSVGLCMVSVNGFQYSGQLDVSDWDSHRGLIEAAYREKGEQVGMGVEILSDSARIEGMAGYSPRSDVRAVLELSGAVVNAIDPIGALSVSAVQGPVTGLLRFEWIAGEPAVQIELRGVLR